MPTFCLSFHAPYRCRHSGACCTAGWTIPVEPARRTYLDANLATAEAGSRIFLDGERLPDGSSILRTNADGACVCHDAGARRCRIQAQLGHDALPAACQHFPRVCLIDRDAAYVTLSHYCPTAAQLLVEPAQRELCATHDIAVVGAPRAFAPMALEGLDARDAFPPLLRPRMLADRDSYRLWEGLLLCTLNEETAAEVALSAILDATEALRGWEPADGPLGDAVTRAFRAADVASRRADRLTLSAASVSFDALVRGCVPAGLSAPPAPGAAGRVFGELVAPRWEIFAAPVRRYLAARAFGNWYAYQGRGLRTVVCSLVAAVSVLRVEAARHCERAGRTLDEALLVEALRSADLLLVHLASREELARRLSDVEEAGAGGMRAAITGA